MEFDLKLCHAWVGFDSGSGIIVYIPLDKGGQEGVYELYTPKGIYGSPQLRGGYEKSPETPVEGDFSYPSPKLRGPINARGHI